MCVVEYLHPHLIASSVLTKDLVYVLKRDKRGGSFRLNPDGRIIENPKAE